MKAGWIYSFIILRGALQTCGAAMNAQLFNFLENRWLASTVSFTLITACFICLFAMFPTPLPGAGHLSSMPWSAPLGGIVGAVQVYGGLTLVQKVGTGTFVGITVTAALTTSLLLDHLGWFSVPVHPISTWRALGGVRMVAGVYLISKS